MQKSSILIILIAFILGIVAANYIHTHWVVLFTLWIMFACSTIVIVHFGKKLLFFRNWINWGLIMIFFLSGMLGYNFKMPSSYENEYSSVYLKDDQLIGEIVDYQKGDGDYDKAIIEIKKVVKYNSQTDVQGELLCYIRSSQGALTKGNIILFQPDIQTIKNKNNPGEFNAEKYWKVNGITAISFVPEDIIVVLGDHSSFSRFWMKTRNYLEDVIRSNISKENQGIAIALALGDKSDLSLERRDHFANAGAMHVLAVSGLHVGILLVFIQWIFKRFRVLRKRHLYLYFALLFLWCFAFLTGMSASVVRAVTMFSILAIGQLMGKQYFSLQAIFGSALILLIINPLLIYDIGFQLSYLAILGIGIFYKKILGIFHSRFKVVNWLWEGTAIGISAQIGTVPLTLYYFHQFPNYFFLSNIGVMIFASIALISIVILLLFHFIPYLVDALSYLVDFIFDLFNVFISWINTLPAVISTGFTPNVLQVILLYSGILFCLYQWRKKNVRFLNWGIISLFIISSTLIYNRENNKSKSELIVLNNYKKVILLKSNRKLFLLYDGEKSPSITELNYLINGYKTSVGVEYEKIPMPLESEIVFSEDICFKHLKSGIKIDYYGQKIFLANQIDKTISNSGYSIIKGAWSPYLSSEDAKIDITEKALIIKPNGKEF